MRESQTASSEARGKERRRTPPPPPSEGDFTPFKRWYPWLVPSIVVANIVLFVITMYVNDCPKNSFSCFGGSFGRFSFQPLKENPLLGPSSVTLAKMGALDVRKVVHDHQVWRLVTAIWLHAGVVHLLANMLSLLFIGIRHEKEFGFSGYLITLFTLPITKGCRALCGCGGYTLGILNITVRIGLLYIVSGFGGNILSALFIQSSISVGASGALFGLLGGMLSELIINWTIYANKLAAFSTLVLIIVINLAMGILPHVDNFAHIGGFIAGFLLGFVLLIRPHFGWVRQRHAPPGYTVKSAKSKHKTYQYVLWAASAILLIVGFSVALVMLLKGVDGNQHCSWCRYLSCVPTSRWSCKSQEVFCETTEIGNQLNLTCLSNGKNRIYQLTEESTSRVQQLCSQLCG